MRKKTTSVLLVGFLMVLTSALASYWKEPVKSLVIFPSPIEQDQSSWNESPFGVFALAYDDCENDIEDPTISAPPKIVVDSDSSKCTASNVSLGTPTTADNCGIKSTTNDAPSVFSIGETTVTWTVTDDSNNTATATQIVTVKDNEVPVITHNGDKNVNNDTGKCGATVNVSASATDNCSVGAVSGSRSDGQALNALFPVGTTTISWSVTDANTNSAVTKTQTIKVADKEAPVIAHNGYKNVNNDSGKCGATVNVSASATDNCSVGAVSGSRSDGQALNALYPVGTTTISWSVTDANTNSAVTKTQKIKVIDNEAPVITHNGDKNINNDAGKCGAVVDVSATATDNCSVGAVSGTRSDGKGLNELYPVGTTTITWSVTDANTNSAVTKTQTIKVIDNEAPVITHNGDKNVNNDAGKCGAVVDVSATATDNCSVGAVAGTRSDGKGLNELYPVGTTIITWRVTDANTNSAVTKTQTIKVIDKEAPVITHNGDKNVNNDTGKCGAVVDVSATATDNCSVGVVSGTRSDGKRLNELYPVGTTTVTWSVADSNLVVAQEVTQTIQVTDNEPPVPSTLTALENWSCGKTIPIPTAQDNCSGAINGITETKVFDAPGEYNIIWTFTDEQNNTSTAVQTIVVPEPTVEVPTIDGTAFCNAAKIPGIKFTGNTLENKSYSWSYESSAGNNINIGIPSSGTGDISAFSAKNITNEPVTALFTVIPFGNDCEGQPVNFSITINPTPTITVPNDIEICAGETINEIDLSNFSVVGSSVSWENDNTEIGLTSSGSGNINAFTAANNTNQNLVANISLAPVANNCEGEVQSFKITVKPDPELTLPEIPELCNGATTEAPIALEGNFDGITFDISGGSSIGLSNRTNVTAIPVFTPANNTEVPVTANITITPKANGCTGDPVEIPITVKPSPVVNTTFSANICSGEFTDIALSGPVANTSYSWTVNAPAGIEGATPGNIGTDGTIEQELINTTSQPQTVTYRITPEADGCTGARIPVNITVNPTPEFEIDLPECPTAVNLTDPAIKNNSNLTYTYWQDENATVSLPNPSEAGLGTYYIKGTSNAGCFIIKEVIVDQILPVIVNLEDAPVEICSGSAFDFLPESSLQETAISWSRAAVGENAATNSLNRNNINPNESLVNRTGSTLTATYIFTLEKNGCINEVAVDVEVSPEPQLVQESIIDICNGSSIVYTPQSNLPNTSITWRRNAFEGNPASSGSGTIDEVLYNDTGVEIGVTYFITLTSAKGCSVEESVSFSLLSGPKVTATASKNNICAGETVDLNSIYDGEQSVEPILFEENFNGSGANWTTYNYSNGGNSSGSRWRLRPNGYTPNYNDNIRSNDGSQFYLSNSDAQGRNTYTETILQYNNSINTVGYSSLEFSFWQYYRISNSLGVVEVSTDRNNWERVYATPNRTTKELVSFNLDGWTGNENLYIRFRYIAYWGYWWAIDNVKLTGEGSTIPDVTWTSSTNPEWTSNEPNPTNISVSRTTTFTATYTDPDIECPGVGTVEVQVKDPLQPEIIANYCSLDQTNQVLLSVSGSYDSYRWVASGQTISTEESLQVGLAQTYTVYVTRDGCEASASITPNENLIANGSFDEPEYTLPYTESNNYGQRDIISNGNILFRTRYNFKVNENDNPDYWGALGPEGTMAVDEDANDYHSNFHGRGHGGRGNFLIVNGDVSIGNVVWQSKTLDIIPDTDYYFSAWTANVNSASPARLRIQVLIPGNNSPVVESTLGDLTNEPVGRWINFYNPELWNSGNYTEAIIRIINENPTAGGNDFGIDDISFAAFRSFDFEFTPENNGPICENEDLEISANLDGGRLPITYEWTGPNGFSRTKTITTEVERIAADTIQLPNATPEMAGEYSLKITDFYGCNIEIKTTTVQLLEKAIVFAGDDMEVCSADPVIHLSEASITHPNLATGFWTTLEGDNNRFEDPDEINAIYHPDSNEVNSGEIQLILTATQDANAVCEPVSDTLTIRFNVSPQIELVPKDVSCFEGDNGEMEIKMSEGTGTPPFTYEWYRIEKEASTALNQTGERATNLTSGTYRVTVTDSNGCPVSAEAIINEPEELIVGTPVQIEEASCFNENSAVITIPVSGGLFEAETISAENIPYSVEILNAAGDQISLDPGNIQYDIETGRFVISGLAGGAAYTFLINTSENCNAIVKTFTTITPPEINPGEAPTNLECGVKTIWLSATPIDPAIGTGSWSYNNGETELLGNPEEANTSFTGQPGEDYTLTWTVNSTANENCIVSEEITISFPPACSQLNFDGNDDYVDLGNNYGMVGSNLSIEAWVKPNKVSGTKTILSKREENSLNSGYDLILSNGSPTFRVGNRSVASAQRLTTDRWYHIAGVYNGQQLQLYVDGIEIQINSNISSNAIVNNNAPAIIGATHASSASGSKNNFDGYIEELRIWKTAIPVEQVRFFMNQRLIKDGPDVNGTVLGNNLNLPNAPEKIGWDNLLGYYQLLAQSELIADGYSNNMGSIGTDANGLLKNIELMQENTAPLPYVLYTTNNGNWHDNSTWKLPAAINGSPISQRDVWDAPNSTGIDQKTKIDWNIVKVSQNIKNPGTPNNMNSITLLGLISEAGVLDMMGMNNIQGNSLTITSYLKLNGIIDLNGESQLIQTEGSIIDQSANLDLSKTGYLEQDQQGTSSSFNYNYWSSPVMPSASASKYKVAEIMYDGSADGTGAWKTINFGNGPFYADGSLTSPIKISNYWINAFRNKKANDYSSWEHVGSDHELLAGEGYTMKGPQSISVADAAARKLQQNYTYKGFPNNGDVQLQVGKGQQYLVGNPYPSAINVEEFIKENTRDGAGRNGVNVFNGAVYFWDHFSGKTHYLEEYIGGYATRNRLDGVPAASTDKRINANNAKGTKVPGAYISVGQGFFINTTLDPAISNFTSVEGGTLTFKNKQRAFAPESPGASMFLRPEVREKEKSSVKEDNRSKIRLNFKSPKGYHRQILVGVDKNATNDFDLGFDALSMDKHKEDMFWLIREHPFVIQGVSNIDRDQVLPLSIKIEEKGEFSIEIAELVNVPEETEIYLRDHLDSTYHNLRENEFKLATEPGTFNDRFEIVFTDGKVVEDTRPKIWLNFESSNGHTRELLVTADEESTDSFDAGKEEILSENLPEDMYWLINSSEFLTQEVPDFDEDRELPLGVKVGDDGTFSINISRLANIPDKMEIFLKDSENKLFHNLRKSAYQTTAEPGSVNDRFWIVFKETISKDEDVLPEGLEIIYVHDTREIIIRNPQLVDISRINLSNLLGQQVHVFYNVPLQQEISLPVARFSSGVYIVKLQSREGSVSKKVILE